MFVSCLAPLCPPPFTHTAPLSAYISPAIRAELSCIPGTAKISGLRPRVI